MTTPPASISGSHPPAQGIPEACHPCVLNQAASAARFAKLAPDQTARILAVARKGLEKAKSTPILVQHIVREVADAVIAERNESPDFDIYARVKEASNSLAMEYAAQLRETIRSADSPLETALHIAAAGNIIDFGAKDHGSLDVEEELRNLQKTPFARYDIEAFTRALANASTLLYLCDNCGEIVFDKLFIEELHREFPTLEIIAALREKPIINDATIEDARRVGLGDAATLVSSGSPYPGTILPETSPEFRNIYRDADIIVSKGQGNFETLLPLSDPRVFFILRIKCEHMARVSGVEKDRLVLMNG